MKRPQPKRRIRKRPVTIPGVLVFADGSEPQLFSSMTKAKRALAYMVERVFPKKKSPEEPKKAWVVREDIT